MSKKIANIMSAVVGMLLLFSITSTLSAQPAAMTTPAVAPAPRVMAAPVMAPTPRPRPRIVKRAPMLLVRRSAVKVAVKPTVMVAAAPVMTVAPVVAPVVPVAMAAVPAATAPVPPVAAPPAATSTPATVAKADSKGSVVGGWIVQVLLYLAGIFLTAFIPVFTAWLYKKLKLTNLEHKDLIDEMVNKAALFGIGKAEEAAYKLRDNPMDSAKKLDLAVKKANEYLVDSGLPEKGASYLADVIESKLGVSRNKDDKPSPAAKDEAKPETEPKEDVAAKAEKK